MWHLSCALTDGEKPTGKSTADKAEPGQGPVPGRAWLVQQTERPRVGEVVGTVWKGLGSQRQVRARGAGICSLSYVLGNVARCIAEQ